jgi:hypothetical protein
VVSFSFAQFILNWWPLLIVLAGMLLTLISLGTKNNDAAGSKNGPADGDSAGTSPGS